MPEKFTTPKVCIFCGSAKLSKEDFIPKWLKKYAPQKKGTAVHQLHYGSYTEGKHVSGKTKRGALQQNHGIVKRTLRVVCESCNNTWMSRLQSGCIPTTVTCIEGGWKALDKNESQKLAAWATMHSMVREFATNELRGIPESDRRDFYIDQAPLPNWHIWIARLGGSRSVVHSTFATMRQALPNDNQSAFVGHTSIINIILGRLVFHCVVTGRTEIFKYLRGFYTVQLGFSPIWFGEALAVDLAPRIVSEANIENMAINTRKALVEVLTHLDSKPSNPESNSN